MNRGGRLLERVTSFQVHLKGGSSSSEFLARQRSTETGRKVGEVGGGVGGALENVITEPLHSVGARRSGSLDTHHFTRTRPGRPASPRGTLAPPTTEFQTQLAD